MPVQEVRDVAMSTGFGTSPQAPPTTIGRPWLPGPLLEPYDFIVLDTTPVNPAAVGKVMVPVFNAANPNLAFWLQNTVPTLALPQWNYGIVTQSVDTASSSNQQGASLYPTIQQQCRITVRGPAFALVTAPNQPVTFGTPLYADANGNLTAGFVPTVIPGAPTAATAVPFGTTGAATVTYNLYARGVNGMDSASSGAVTSTTSNAALSAANGNTISATVPSGTSQIIVVRTVGGPSQGVLAVVQVPAGATTFSFNDTGLPAGAATYTPNVTPTANDFGGAVLALAQANIVAGTIVPVLIPVIVGGY